jgi:hypothetical protein
VVAKPVGLDDEAEVGPIEVDLEAVHPLRSEWWRKASSTNEGLEQALQRRVRQDKAVSIE